MNSFKINFVNMNLLSIFAYNSLSHTLTFLVWNLKVRVNDPKQDPPLFITGVIGKDSAIARHGIHGLYWLLYINVSGLLLEKGVNTIFLTHTIFV